MEERPAWGADRMVSWRCWGGVDLLKAITSARGSSPRRSSSRFGFPALLVVRQFCSLRTLPRCTQCPKALTGRARLQLVQLRQEETWFSPSGTSHSSTPSPPTDYSRLHPVLLSHPRLDHPPPHQHARQAPQPPELPLLPTPASLNYAVLQHSRRRAPLLRAVHLHQHHSCYRLDTSTSVCRPRWPLSRLPLLSPLPIRQQHLRLPYAATNSSHHRTIPPQCHLHVGIRRGISGRVRRLRS